MSHMNCRHAFALRMNLGDPEFWNTTARVVDAMHSVELVRLLAVPVGMLH